MQGDIILTVIFEMYKNIQSLLKLAKIALPVCA